MRFGLLSDIHSNYEALVKSYGVLVDAGCDKYICLGDVVGYGAKPKECIDFVREKAIDSVKGNHDFYTTQPRMDWPIQPYARDAIFWTQDILDQADIDWLKELPFEINFEDISFVHASLECHDGDYWPYILSSKAAVFHFFFQKGKFAFFGHTHIPLLFVQDEGNEPTIEFLTNRRLHVEGHERIKFLINPGSVGQPRDFDRRASVVVFDSETEAVEIIRVEYDIEKTQNEILDAGLPKMLAYRLSRGS